MKSGMPGVENACRYSADKDDAVFTIGERSMYSSGVFADSSVFSMLTMPFVQRDVKNFMNLATAQSARRAKEVGVRKVLGSNRNNLILQFICEAMRLSFLAICNISNRKNPLWERVS